MWLGERANERNVKALSRQGLYKVLHFRRPARRRERSDPDKGDAEAFSGLARAFFYAMRSLRHTGL